MKDSHAAATHVAMMLLLGAAVFLPALGQEKTFESREARQAEIARTMAESGKYAVPLLFGRPHIDKAPLFNWTVAALFKLTGRVDFLMARLPSAMSAIASMLVVYLLGRRRLTARAGVIAAGIWATSWMAIEWGRASRMDMMMAFLVLCGALLADIAAALYPFLIPGLFEPTGGTPEARMAALSIPAGAPVADYHVQDVYLCFKLNRPIVLADKPERLEEFMNEPGLRYVLARAEDEQAAGLTRRPVRTVGQYKVKDSNVCVLEVNSVPGSHAARDGAGEKSAAETKVAPGEKDEKDTVP